MTGTSVHGTRSAATAAQGRRAGAPPAGWSALCRRSRTGAACGCPSQTPPPAPKGGEVCRGWLRTLRWQGSNGLAWLRASHALPPRQAPALPSCPACPATHESPLQQQARGGPTLQPLTTWSTKSSTLHVRSCSPLPGVSRISALAARGLQRAGPGQADSWRVLGEGASAHKVTQQACQVSDRRRRSREEAAAGANLRCCHRVCPGALPGGIAPTSATATAQRVGRLSTRRTERALAWRFASNAAAAHTCFLHPPLPRLLQLLLAGIRQLSHLQQPSNGPHC